MNKGKNTAIILFFVQVVQVCALDCAVLRYTGMSVLCCWPFSFPVVTGHLRTFLIFGLYSADVVSIVSCINVCIMLFCLEPG
jgi:hypothetical protein